MTKAQSSPVAGFRLATARAPSQGIGASVTSVTATSPAGDYLPRIGSMPIRDTKWSRKMTKLYTLIAASLMFVPFALAALHQAAQMVA